MLPLIGEGLTTAPHNSTGLVLHPPNDPTFYRRRDRVIHQRTPLRLTLLSLYDCICYSGIGTEMNLDKSVALQNDFEKDLSPCAGVYLLLAHVSYCQGEFSLQDLSFHAELTLHSLPAPKASEEEQ